MESSMARRLWRVLSAVLYMLRRGMSKRKLLMDLHLLLRRGKIAGKALGNLVAFHGQHGHAASAAAAVSSSFSCRALDPAVAVYDPRGGRRNREVEFSCSNTPSYPTLHLKRRRRNRRHVDSDGGEAGYLNYDASDIARVFDILQQFDDTADHLSAVSATPSPLLWASSPAAAPVRQLRITDSPFPARDDAAGADCAQVDRQAEEFIRRFYEQLRIQHSVAAATPDYNGYGGSYGSKRPVETAAGMA